MCTSKKRAFLCGWLCQFGLMPLMSWGLARAWGFPPNEVIGLILCGCAPGGSTSNLFTYWARGNVSLSICMSAASTICGKPRPQPSRAPLRGRDAEQNNAGGARSVFADPRLVLLLARPILLELEQEGETGFGWVRDIVGSLFAVLVPVTFGIMARHWGGPVRLLPEREKRPMIYKWVELVGTAPAARSTILAVVYQSTQVGRRRRRASTPPTRR